MSTPGQQSLSNFYESVKFSHPRVAAEMNVDVQKAAIFALGQDKTPGQESAANLRNLARDNDLPEVLCRVLESALTELGYS